MAIVEQPIDTVARLSAPAPVRGRLRTQEIVVRVLSWIVSLALLLGVWWAFLKFFHVDGFIGKTPLDVWKYVTSDPEAAAHREELWNKSVETLTDASIGLVVGTAAAVFFAICFNLARSVEQSVMPMAMVLRSVPLVAMTPLIRSIFGTGLACATVVTGIVTFFPTLVNVTLALRATPQASIDLCRAYGASRAHTMRSVQFPSALPALFASLRIAAPLALVGALLAEYLATSKGLGYEMVLAGPQGEYTKLWAATALVTIYSLIIYTVIAAIEKRVLARYADLTG